MPAFSATLTLAKGVTAYLSSLVMVPLTLCDVQLVLHEAGVQEVTVYSTTTVSSGSTSVSGLVATVND